MSKFSFLNKQRIECMLLGLIGVVLILFSSFSNSNISNVNLIQGLGVGCIAGGVGGFIGTFLGKKRFKQNYKILEQDERLHNVWQKAGCASYNLTFYSVLLLYILVLVLDLSAIAVCGIIIILMPLSNLAFTHYYNKRL